MRTCQTEALSAADKLAWLTLYKLTKGGRDAVLVTAAMIGADQGTSNTAGRERIKNLVRTHFVHDHGHQGKKGVYKLSLLDWRAAIAGLTVRGRKDPQVRIDFAGDGSEGLGTSGPDESCSDGSTLDAGDGSSERLSLVRFPNPDLAEGEVPVETARPGPPPARAPVQVPSPEPPGGTVLAKVPVQEPSPTPPDSRVFAKEPVQEPSRPSRARETSNFKKEYKSTSNFSLLTSTSESLAREVYVGAAKEPVQEPSPAEIELARVTAAKRLQAQLDLAAARDRQAAAATPEQPLGAFVMARIDAQVSPAAQAQRAGERYAVMWRRVADPSPKPHVFRSRLCRLAWACETHGLKWDEVLEALRQLDEAQQGGTLRGSRSAYFNGCIDRLLIRCGLPPRKPAPKPK